MTDDFGADLLTLLDEDGQEHEFEVLDIIDDDEGTFYALLPTFEDPQAKLDDEGTYYIFQSIEEDGEQELVEVEDDALLDRLAQEFEAHFVELYPRRRRSVRRGFVKILKKCFLPGARDPCYE